MDTSLQDALSFMKNQHGVSLEELNRDQPIMLVFLRHFGCIFCMEAMKDIAEQRATIEAKGVKIVLVHMSENDVAESYLTEKNLGDIDHVSDPECRTYEMFGLLKGKFNQLFGLQVWLRTAELTLKDLSSLRRKQIGDALQMPGVFLIRNGAIADSYIHSRASDRPNYEILASCCSTSAQAN